MSDRRLHVYTRPRQADLDRVTGRLVRDLPLARTIRHSMPDPSWPPQLREAARFLEFNAWNDLARFHYSKIVWC